MRLTSSQEWLEPFVRFLTWTREHLPEVLSGFSGLCAIALAVLTFLHSNGRDLTWWAVGIGLAAVIATVTSWLARQARQASVSELERRIVDLESERDDDLNHLKSLTQPVLLDLLDECNARNEHTRISVYQYDEKYRRFIRVGRASANPLLRDESASRPDYPHSQGVIAKVWTSNDPYTYPRLPADPEDWAQRCVELFEMNLEVARAIPMKSRSYLGVKLGYGNDEVGVLILESLNSQGVTSKMGDSIQKHDAYSEVVVMLAASRKIPVEAP